MEYRIDRLSYPYLVEPAEEGGFLIQFLDLEEAFNEAESMEEAHFNAAEVLSLSLGGRIEDEFNVPHPTKKEGKNIFYIQPEPDIQAAL